MVTLKRALGNQGEQLAQRHLLSQGFSIRENNYRCRYGEIDIVAERDEEVVFVEVKTRRSQSFGLPSESINQAKASHLVASSQHYLEQHSMPDADWRIDLLSVSLGAPCSSGVQIEHLEYAVQLA